MSEEEKKPAPEPKPAAEEPKPKARRHKARHSDGKGNKDRGVMTKVIATVFGAVVAPILVALGIGYFKDLPKKEKSDTTPAVTTTKPADPIVHLVTSNLNEHFYAFQPPDKKEEVDPEEFRYEDNPPRIVFLQKKQGVLTTKEEYENYTLYLWFRWREKQWGPHAGMPRRAGIGIHNTGPDGAFEGTRYSEGIIVLLGEGETGSVTLAGAPERIQCLARVKEGAEGLGSAALLAGDLLFLGAQGPCGAAMGAGPLPYLLGMADPLVRTRQTRYNHIRREYDEHAKEVPLVTGDPKHWDLRIYRQGFPWYASRGGGGLFHAFGAGWYPGGDAKLPVLRPPPPTGYKPNQWTEVQITCNQDAITVTVGPGRTAEKVMKLTDLKLANSPLTKGRIALHTNGAELEVGRLDIHKMDAKARQPEKAPDKAPDKGRP